MLAEESNNHATKTQSAWSCITVERFIKWGTLRVFCTWRLPKWAVNDDVPPFFLSQAFSENANKQRCITSFSLLWNNWGSLLINDDIHLFLSPSHHRLPLYTAWSLIQRQGMCLYGNSDQPVSNSVTHDPFLQRKVRETLNPRPWWIWGHSITPQSCLC